MYLCIEVTGSEEVKKEIAVVTGVGRREALGFEICRQLGERGYDVVLTARRAEAAEALANELSAIGVTVSGIALDITDESSIDEVTHRITESYGCVDALVNNAGIVGPYGENAAANDMSVARSIFDSNLFGTWRISQALYPMLKKSANGRIVNVTSGAGSHADPDFGLSSPASLGVSYAVSKAALNALTAKWANQERDSGVRVIAVCPGFTATFEGGEAMGARPVRDGAASIVWAVETPKDGPNGGFYRDGKPLGW